MKNILGIILVCDEQNMYTIGVKSKYARSHFDLCPQKLLTLTHGLYSDTSPSCESNNCRRSRFVSM